MSDGLTYCVSVRFKNTASSEIASRLFDLQLRKSKGSTVMAQVLALKLGVVQYCSCVQRVVWRFCVVLGVIGGVALRGCRYTVQGGWFEVSTNRFPSRDCGYVYESHGAVNNADVPR